MDKELEKVLKNVELTDEQIEAIGKQMAENKVFVTKEEKIEERYSKAKSQKESLESELKEAQALIADLKESGKTSEDLQTKISEYEKQLQDLQTQNQLQAKQSAVDIALIKSGARNPKAVSALLDAEKIELGDDGVKGLDEQLEALKVSEPYLFQSSDNGGQPGVINEEDPNGSSNDDKDAFDAVLEKY